MGPTVSATAPEKGVKSLRKINIWVLFLRISIPNKDDSKNNNK